MTNTACRLIPRLSLSLAMIIVGSSVVAGKIMIQGLPVNFSSLLRFALATAVLLPILLAGAGLPRLSVRSLAVLAVQSLSGSVLFTICLLYGLRHTSPASAGIITSSTPACIALLVWVFMKERPTGKALVGIGLAVVGVTVLNGEGFDESGSFWGNMLVMAAVGFESVFLLMRKAVREPLSPLAAAFMISFFGMIWFLLPGLWEVTAVNFAQVPASAWWSVVYYALAITVAAYYFWFAGITRVPASEVGVYTALMPVSAVLLSAIVLGEKVHPAELAGCACVMFAIVLVR